MQTAPSFTYNDATEKFEGPDQKALKERDMAKATQEQERKQVEQPVPLGLVRLAASIFGHTFFFLLNEMVRVVTGAFCAAGSCACAPHS